MRLRSLFRFSRILALILPVLGFTSPSTADPLTMGINVWPPYVGMDLPHHGFSTEITQTALKRAGYDSQAFGAPWARVLRGTQNGQLDVIPGAWFTEERAEFLVYGHVIAANRLVFITRTDFPQQVETIDDLKGLIVGVGRDYGYPEFFEANATFVREVSENLEINLRKLEAGKIDVTVGDELVTRYTANQLFGQNPPFRYSSKSIDTKFLHFAVSKKRADAEKIVARFNQALWAMREDGTYDAIKARHGLQ